MFVDMYNELAGVVPNLSPVLAQTYIRRAWRAVCRARPWSFTQKTGFLNAPAIINGGTVSVTQGSNAITFDATAKALLTPVVDALPPLVGRQFRVPATGSIFTITDYDSTTGIAKLDNLYRDATNAAAVYAVYQAYYGTPVSLDNSQNLVAGPPVERIVSIIDPNQGYRFSRLHVARTEIDRIDPQRSSQQQPVWASDALSLADGSTVWEFWPHPVAIQTFAVTYQTLYTNLDKPTDTLPDIIDEGLIVAGALARYAIPWAILNAPRFPNLKGVNFAVLLNDAKTEYQLGLQAAKLVDDGRMNQTKVPMRQRRNFPVDAAFIQKHDVGRM